MAASRRGKNVAVSEHLRSRPQDFSFFQALRVLEAMSRERSAAEPGYRRTSIGGDAPPRREVVRFQVHASHSFPPSEIVSLTTAGHNGQLDDADGDPPRLTIAFLGLIGPMGVLPRHYTQLVIDRVRQKDYAQQRFLDLFHHRLVSLFFRAWEKHRFPIAYERARRGGPPKPADEDTFTRGLFSLLGLGTPHLRGRLDVDDEALLYYGGLFAHQPRNAVSLERAIADYFQLPTQVLQFVGQWLKIDPDDQSRLGSGDRRQRANNELGISVVIGERMWSVESKFRVRLGPLSYRDFRRFTPLGEALRPLCQLVRLYVGAEFDFDVQPVLRAEDVPATRLGGDAGGGSHLAWNTWLISRPLEHDADEPIFSHAGSPTR